MENIEEQIKNVIHKLRLIYKEMVEILNMLILKMGLFM